MKSQGNKRCIDSVRFVGARESAAARPRWRADVESIVEVLSPSGGSWRESPYTVVAITLLAALKLIALLVPKLQRATGGAVVVARQRRALGVIFSRALSLSGLHRDPDDSLIVCIAEQRTIWLLHQRQLTSESLARRRVAPSLMASSPFLMTTILL